MEPHAGAKRRRLRRLPTPEAPLTTSAALAAPLLEQLEEGLVVLVDGRDVVRGRLRLLLERRRARAHGDELRRRRIVQRPLLLLYRLHVRFFQQVRDRLRPAPARHMVLLEDVPPP